MGDAADKREGRATRSPGSGLDEPHWRGRPDECRLEQKVHDMYRGVLDEPLPAKLLDIVRRIPELDEQPDAPAPDRLKPNRPAT